MWHDGRNHFERKNIACRWNQKKVLAANRAGITKVLLPKENEKDIEEIPDNVRKKMKSVL